MTDLTVADSLKDRRQALKSKRRLKGGQTFWRFSVLFAGVGALVWVISWPDWVIRDRSQVILKGNQWVSRDQLYQQLPLTYPQIVWKLSTEQLSRKMEALPFLEKVEVTRQLLPAQLTITVAERHPVAIAFKGKKKGYLDAGGKFIPTTAYQDKNPKRILPQTPQFLGYGNQYTEFWRKAYPLLQVSPVKIQTINGLNPSNITLTTDLGLVHLGSNLAKFPQQLQTLNRLQKLPGRVPKNRLAYIDLTAPDAPSIELKAAAKPSPGVNKLKNP
ncbi:MAG: cell division protein FtsQ/DivIB [Microcystaceae cyanobacterium]